MILPPKPRCLSASRDALRALRTAATSAVSYFRHQGKALLGDERGMWGLPGMLGIDPISGYIKSVQQVSITLANSAESNTATINAVNTATTFIVFQGVTTDNSSNADCSYAYVTLTNSTTVTAYRNSGHAAGSVTLTCTVIEATPSLVQNVQYGTVITTTPLFTNTATISAVDTSRSAVFYLGQSGGGGVDLSNNSAVTLTNSTTVTADIGHQTEWTTGFVVVQFQAAVIQSRQQFTCTFTTGNATDTQTISSVDPNLSMIVYGGQKQTDSGGNSTHQYYLQLTSATNVNLVRTATTTWSRSAYFTVIEFKPHVIKQATQRGTITLTNVTSNTATITSTNVNKTICNYVGFNCGNTVQPRADRLALTLTNATTITATVQFAQASSRIISYETIEFIP